jgi:hypothetical protein
MLASQPKSITVEKNLKLTTLLLEHVLLVCIPAQALVLALVPLHRHSAVTNKQLGTLHKRKMEATLVQVKAHILKLLTKSLITHTICSQMVPIFNIRENFFYAARNLTKVGPFGPTLG